MRETHEKSAVRFALGGAQCVGTVPHPVLALGFVERIHVDEGFPFGGFGAVRLEGRAAPQAALVLGVGPEVVEVVAALCHRGNAVARVENLENFRFELGGQRIGVELTLGAGVTLAHPRELLFTGDVFEPQMRVAHDHSSLKTAILTWESQA